MMNVQAIDTAPIEAEIERLKAALEAAQTFNAAIAVTPRRGRPPKENVVELTAGQRAAATRKANREAEEQRRAASRARRSAAMKESWSNGNRKVRKSVR